MMNTIAKKIVFITLVIIAVCIAEPVFAAGAKTPFADVPEGSWAYDAIARLSSRGIISGYPDGLYKGRQSMTRHEAASIVARAAANLDRSRANAQDAEVLKRLFAEFRDELDALGVRMDTLGSDAGALKNRLGGWRLSGLILMDIEHRRASNIDFISDCENMGSAGFGDARIDMERWYGDKNMAYFLARFRAFDNRDDSRVRSFEMEYFYTKIPFYYGSFITVGYAGADDLDARFAYETPGTGRYSSWGWFDDNQQYMLRLDFNFVILNFTAYVSHGQVDGSGGTKFNSGVWEEYSPHAWNIFTNLDVKLNQNLGFGLGAQYLIHDDYNIARSSAIGEGKAWSDIFTSWFGVDYDFLNGAILHGIIYYQRAKTDDVFWGTGDAPDRPDGGIAWRVALELDQDVLGFTSLYAEYMRMQYGFFAPCGIENNILLGHSEFDKVSFFGNVANHDISVWKIGANQQWNDKLSTWLFYADVNGKAAGEYSREDAGLRQYGIGVEYAYSNNVMFGLNYLKWEGKDSFSGQCYSRVRFTTQVTF